MPTTATVTLWRPVGLAELQVAKDFLDRYEIHSAGGKAYQEYWIPAEDLDAFNAIVGEIRVTTSFH